MKEATARPAPAAHADDPADFVRQVRRRSLWRGALALAVPAALLNEAVRWAAVGGALLLRRKIPVLDVGAFLAWTAQARGGVLER